ncbi:hypothetical protein [Atopobacter phocae]|uniref:hypothetical protein n=1 Tax=Atopobacter phocae TaxID=136492 RepID=UPI000472D608|nr:hypothetical protein [Atopobacter phocae]
MKQEKSQPNIDIQALKDSGSKWLFIVALIATAAQLYDWLVLGKNPLNWQMGVSLLSLVYTSVQIFLLKRK